MKWNSKYKNNQVVKVKKFAFIPTRIDGEGVWVWNEYYYVSKTYYNGVWLFEKKSTV